MDTPGLAAAAFDSSRLHRAGRRIRVSRLVSDVAGRVPDERRLVSVVAFPYGLARDPPPERVPARAREEDYFPGARRFRSAVDRTVHGGRQASESRAAGFGRELSQAAHYLPGALTGGLVNLCDRSQSCQAQHLRFSRPQSENLLAATLLGSRRPAPARAAFGTLSHPALAADARAAPEEPAVLEDPGQPGHRMYDPAGTHYVSA